MHRSVQNNFMKFTEQFEGGAIDYMFLDVAGRVGTAFGIDLDFNGSGPSPSLALSRSQGLPKAKALNWVVRAAGAAASTDQVAREWETIKALPMPARVYTWYYQYTKLQLTRESMENRVMQLLKWNEATLKQNAAFKDFESWPADAQLAVLGLSWNGVGHIVGNTHGSLSHPESFRAACKTEDFNLASTYCRMVSAVNNASIYRRSMAQKTLLLNAAIVVREEVLGSYQRSTLYWPRMLAPRAVTTPPHPYLVRS